MAPSFTTYWVPQEGQVRIMRNTRPSFAEGKQECAAIGKAAAPCEKPGGTGGEVLRALDFRLAKGGFYFLTGPSGAGKTSLLQLLYLARRPTRGRIQLFDQDLTDAPRDVLPD